MDVNTLTNLVYLNLFLSLILIVALLYDRFYRTPIEKLDRQREIKEELKFDNNGNKAS